MFSGKQMKWLDVSNPAPPPLAARFLFVLSAFLALQLSVAFTGELAAEILGAMGQQSPSTGWKSLKFKHKIGAKEDLAKP